MSEIKQISTSTIATINGNSLNIHTFYRDGVSNIISAFISELVRILNLTSIIEGELALNIDSENNIFLSVNSEGELILTTTGNEASKYSIDQTTGNLIYVED